MEGFRGPAGDRVWIYTRGINKSSINLPHFGAYNSIDFSLSTMRYPNTNVRRFSFGEDSCVYQLRRTGRWFGASQGEKVAATIVLNFFLVHFSIRFGTSFPPSRYHEITIKPSKSFSRSKLSRP